MRLLMIRVARGQGSSVLEAAQRHDGVNLALVEAHNGENATDLVFVHVSNRQVEGLLDELESRSDLHVTLLPQGVLALHPPADQAADQVTDVQLRSPVEVFLDGLQSIGSWKGFLGYAALAGVVVWIGLFTNTPYLLVAAMLLAPYAGPAMNLALATARGDLELLWRSLLRYCVSLLVTIGVAALLSWIFQQQIATPSLVEQSLISSVALLLPLAAGAAGAVHLIQSERNSLVSGASVGIMVAASLAPPAGAIGMAAVIGRWEMALDNCYLLVLQLFAINFSGALLFRLFGLTTRGTRYDRGRKKLFVLSMAVSAAAIAGLLWMQLRTHPDLQRSTAMARASRVVKEAVESSRLARLVENNTRFTRAEITGQNTLLSVVYVQAGKNTDLGREAIEQRLTTRIQQALSEKYPNVTPLVSVTVLKPPFPSPTGN